MNGLQIRDRLKVIREKVEQGGRLSLDDGIFLYDPEVSLHEVGELANWKREQISGNVGYYNINTHLNPDRKSTRLNSSHSSVSRMPSSA